MVLKEESGTHTQVHVAGFMWDVTWVMGGELQAAVAGSSGRW